MRAAIPEILPLPLIVLRVDSHDDNRGKIAAVAAGLLQKLKCQSPKTISSAI